MSFDTHLSDDEVPPGSDFGYNHSEYDYSDPGTPDDRLPSVPVDSPPPEDVPFYRPRKAHRLSVSSEHEEEAILGLLDLRRRPRVSSFASDLSAPDLVSTISPETENDPSLFPTTPDRSSMDPVDHRRIKVEEEVRDFLPYISRSNPCLNQAVIMDEPPQLISSNSDVEQICPVAASPILEIVPEGTPFSDPPDEIHEDPRSPTHPSREVVDAALSPISTSPATGSEKVQGGDISSVYPDIADLCDEDPVATVPDATPSPAIPGPALSTPPTPKRPMSRTTSRSRSRSLSPSLLSSPLTCLSSSPIREEERRQSSPESDLTDVETASQPMKTSVKRRSIGGVDARASKKSRVETASVDSAADTGVRGEPESKRARETGEKPSGSSSPSPSPESSPASRDVTAMCSIADSERTDQGLMGMVVEALAMTRASSTDVESIRKVVVVRPTFFFSVRFSDILLLIRPSYRQDTRPSLKTEHTKAHLKQLLLEILDCGEKAGFFGSVPSSGKVGRFSAIGSPLALMSVLDQDDHGKPLPPRYFYVPEKDVDQERAALLRNMMPRAAGRRSESMKYKQYYWKPLGKWSRWDAEDDL